VSIPNPPPNRPSSRRIRRKTSVTVNNPRDNCTIAAPEKTVTEAVELAREIGTTIKRKPKEIHDNSFVNNME